MTQIEDNISDREEIEDTQETMKPQYYIAEVIEHGEKSTQDDHKEVPTHEDSQTDKHPRPKNNTTPKKSFKDAVGPTKKSKPIGFWDEAVKQSTRKRKLDRGAEGTIKQAREDIDSEEMEALDGQNTTT